MKDAPPPADGTREEFLTARQLASILQVSESTVRRLAREGRIPSIRLTSRLMRFNLKSVLKSLDSGTARPRSSRRHDPDADLDERQQLMFTELL